MDPATFIDRLQTSEEASFKCLTSVGIQSIFHYNAVLGLDKVICFNVFKLIHYKHYNSIKLSFSN